MPFKNFLNSIVNSNNTGGSSHTTRTSQSHRANHMFALLNPSGHSTLIEDGMIHIDNDSTLSAHHHQQQQQQQLIQGNSSSTSSRHFPLQQQQPSTTTTTTTTYSSASTSGGSGGGGGDHTSSSSGHSVEEIEIVAEDQQSNASRQELIVTSGSGDGDGRRDDTSKKQKGRKNLKNSSTRPSRSRSYDHLESVASVTTNSTTALDLISMPQGEASSSNPRVNQMSSSSTSQHQMDRHLIEHDRRIQRQIELESKKPKRVRVLVLGSGKSGKSTLIRKVKLIDGDYTLEQANEFKAKILKFVLNNAKYVIKNSPNTELKDNIKRKNQLLQMWKFNNQTMNGSAGGSNIQNSTSLTPTSTSSSHAILGASASGNSSSSSSHVLSNNDNNSSSNNSPGLTISQPRKSMSMTDSTLSRISSSLGESSPISHRVLSPPSTLTQQPFIDEGQRITNTFLNPEAVELFKSLWRDKCVKSNFEQLCLNNSVLYNAKYFFDKIDTIASRKYVPSSKDILTTYIASNAIETVQLNYTFPCEFVDITGQRNERRKFIHSHFDKDSVSAIVFLVSLTEYCEYSFSLYPSSRDHDNDKQKTNHEQQDPLHFQPTQPKEDKHILSSNMQNSLSLFKEILMYYNDMPIILLFTKLDIFKRRIKRVPLNVCFPDFDYSGDHVFLYTSFIAGKLLKHECCVVTTCCANICDLFDIVR